LRWCACRRTNIISPSFPNGRKLGSYQHPRITSNTPQHWVQVLLTPRCFVTFDVLHRVCRHSAACGGGGGRVLYLISQSREMKKFQNRSHKSPPNVTGAPKGICGAFIPPQPMWKPYTSLVLRADPLFSSQCNTATETRLAEARLARRSPRIEIKRVPHLPTKWFCANGPQRPRPAGGRLIWPAGEPSTAWFTSTIWCTKEPAGAAELDHFRFLWNVNPLPCNCQPRRSPAQMSFNSMMTHVRSALFRRPCQIWSTPASNARHFFGSKMVCAVGSG